MKKVILLSVAFIALSLCSTSGVNAQGVGINPSGNPAANSAMLDVSATNKGMLIPRLTTTQRDAISAPDEGLQIFNTTTKCFEYYAYGLWQTLGCAICPLPSAVTASASPNPLCEGSTLTLTGNALYATSWNWTGPNGFTSSLQNPTISGITTAGAGVYTLTANNVCGSAAPVNTASVTVNAAPSASTTGTHTPSATQIIWNWNTVSGATGYKWGTTNVYSSATDNAASTSFTQTGLTCNTVYSLYVWAYNSCFNSTATTLTQTTSACPFICGSILTDSRDGKTYNTVFIGSQCWMAQNLNYGTYVTSHSPPQIAGEKYCQSLTSGNDPSCPMGGLYDWENMMSGSLSCNGTGASQVRCSTPVQGICPAGWHIPSHYEWTRLERVVGGSDSTAFPYDETTIGWLGTAGEGSAMKEAGTSHWATPNNCTPPGSCNSSGFTALPSGYSWAGGFYDVRSYGYWWSSTESGASYAWRRNLSNGNTEANRYAIEKPHGLSVRCVLD